MKHVLVVTDDDHTKAWMHRALAGMDTHVVDVDRERLGDKLLQGEFDLVMLDGGTRAMDLVHRVEEAASSGVDLRVLLLVEPEGLAGLRMPARIPSDFMVRGGSSEEFAARVRMLLWPGEERSEADLVRVDDLVLNLATYQAHTSRGPIDFTYQEYSLFSFLVTHPNRAYSRALLLNRVWGSDYFGGERTVDVHVRRVRAKLGGELARRLQTVRGVGYLWQG